ncbi:hypothetical protein [Streptococcus halichoeri]|uniref:hypothetical protein n=1 Tax=Streptococcus halichoeri TaxID=254785 RepID=UPI00135A4589|nr:hypothetical protein [Streptococcus halichoeri]
MKKLLMVVAMCLAFCAVAVNAEGRKWGLAPDQQKVYDDNNQPIHVSIDNDNNITVALPKGWSMWFGGRPTKVNNKPLTDYQETSAPTSEYGVKGQPNTSPKVNVSGNQGENLGLSSIYNDNQGPASIPVTITLGSPTKKGDTLAITFQGGGFYAGSVYLWDSETITEAKQRAEDEKMEDMYLEYINYDNSKTWYQRLGDSIRDQWWNFKGLF